MTKTQVRENVVRKCDSQRCTINSQAHDQELGVGLRALLLLLNVYINVNIQALELFS